MGFATEKRLAILGATFQFVVGCVLSALEHFGWQFAPWVWKTWLAGNVGIGVLCVGVFLHLIWQHSRSRWGLGRLGSGGIVFAAASALLLVLYLVGTRGLIPSAKQSAPITKASLASDIEIRLVPDGVTGDDMNAHFLITNTAPKSVTLSIFRYSTQIGANFSTNRKLEIPSGKHRLIALETRGNGLAMGRSVTVEFAYQFQGEPLRQDGFMQFDIPANAKPGSQIEASQCCTSDTVDLAAKLLREIEFTLDHVEKTKPITISKVPETRPDGSPFQGAFGSGKRVLFINMASGWVVFRFERGGKLMALETQVRPTVDGLHEVVIWWDDSAASAGMTLDGVAGQLVPR